MKTLYLECAMGAAGDMLTAALLELCPDRQAFLDKMNALGLPGVRVEAEPAVKCGVTGTHMRVTVNGEEEESLDAHGVRCRMAPPHLVMQSAVSVALEAETVPESEYVSARDLRPVYLRPPQAVPLRERMRGIEGNGRN